MLFVVFSASLLSWSRVFFPLSDTTYIISHLQHVCSALGESLIPWHILRHPAPKLTPASYVLRCSCVLCIVWQRQNSAAGSTSSCNLAATFCPNPSLSQLEGSSVGPLRAFAVYFVVSLPDNKQQVRVGAQLLRPSQIHQLVAVPPSVALRTSVYYCLFP